jgi:DNA-binding beta-propeller fold protein YncE
MVTVSETLGRRGHNLCGARELGEAREMKLCKISSYLTLAILVPCLLFTGCGSKNTGAIAITVTVTSSVGNTLILGQSTTLNATVVGATNTNVNWVGCTYTTTPPATTTTPNPKPSTPTACPTDGSFGTLSNTQTTGTATFTAPSVLPDRTKFPSLVVIITANAVANTAKTGSASLAIDSGITVTLTPSTAAVPTKEAQPFFAVLTNDLKAQGVTWSLTQTTPSSTTPTTPNIYAGLPTCTVSGNATGCGSIDANGIYTAPSAVPTAAVPANASTTPTNLTVVATSVEDPTRFAIGTIAITQGGPITFNGISPTIAPQGAAYWDIYLNAPNMSSASQVTLTDAGGNQTAINSAAGQIKVLFPIPTGTVTNPPSIGARVRLFANNLAGAGPVTVSVTDPGEPVTTCAGTPLPTGCSSAGTFTYNIIPVRPTTLTLSPNDVVQGVVSSGTIPMTIDGGYFGPGGQLANVFFDNTVPATTNGQGQPLSNSKQLHVEFQSGPINNGPPGLYSLSVNRTTAPLPSANSPAIADFAVFPNYSPTPPGGPPTLTGAAVAAGTNPSAIDIDPTLGVVAVAEVGSDPTKVGAVQFYNIGTGTLTPVGAPVPVGKIPTGLSVNRNNHTLAVVNYGDQSVTVLPIPGASAQAPGTPFTVDISNALQGQASPAPLPYSIGVDPDTNMALVAYSSTSTASAANLGFIVNLNTGANPFGCPIPTSPPQNGAANGECLFAQVTLNTGQYPQIAMAPHGHLALVTPGGSGVVRGVDVTKASQSATLKTLTLAAGIVTVTTTAANGLVPGNSGTVLITGVPAPGSAANSTNQNFNGVFNVAAISDTSFTYVVNSTSSGTVTIPSGTTAQVLFSTPNLIFGGLSQTTQGIAINPVTSTAALADANAIGTNGPQINLLNDLDQTVSSISFFATCTFYSTSCANGAELLGTTAIAWQPYSNAIVSYNPVLNQLSVSDPVTARRYALVNLGTAGNGKATLTVQNGSTNSLTLWGGLAVDPATNQAFVVMSGSGAIQLVNLGPTAANALKTVQISEIVVPSPNPALGVIGGIPNATVPQGTLTSTTDLAGVQIFGSGFDATTQVRLDLTPIPSGNVTLVSSRQLTATIPAANLSFPHRFALDAVTPDAPGGGQQSNAVDFFVIQAVDLSKICTDASGNPTNTMPSSVAIADQLVNGPFSPIAVVSNSGCNNISVVDINPNDIPSGAGPNPGKFGTILGSVGVGASPQGVAVSQPFGLALVANNSAGTASVVDLTKGKLAVPDISTGKNPSGVAINDATGAAIVANTGSDTVSEINLGLLFGSTPPTTLTPVSIGGIHQPTAVAIDPDRGTNNQGIAVVTGLQIVNGPTQGVLQVLDIGLSTPTISTSVNPGSVTAPSTGIVFDPTIFTGTANNGVFYASSSGGNVITSFNPDNSQSTSVNVGINPTALALNTETGAILTTNLAGKTTSLVDTTASPLRTVKTIGLPGSGQFGVAIDQFTNLAVIVDQANNRLLIFPMPN